MKQKKYDLKTTILSNQKVAEDHYMLHCNCPEIAYSAEPGQFIHVLFDAGGGLLLRRPFTIYTIEGQQISMLYQVIGEGTSILSKMKPGTAIHVLGPLGNTFTVCDDLDLAIVVGGGAGIASLMLLITELKTRQIETSVLVGAMNESRLLSQTDIQDLGITPQIATDDGSVGYQGLVTDLLSGLLSETSKHRITVFTCGPYGMLKAVANICHKFDTVCQVAMENRMGCALGVCLGCVCKVRIESNSEEFEYQRVCTEGPVFSAPNIIWDI